MSVKIWNISSGRKMVLSKYISRAYDRILKVARTIADLDGSPGIEVGHLSEAINFRNLDRDSWGRR